MRVVPGSRASSSARRTVSALWFLALAIPASAAQDPSTGSFAEAIVQNVASVRAGDYTGFGFIVGLSGPELIIATAYHTVEVPGVVPTVCFPLNGEMCATARIVSIADPVGNLPALDLAFLAVRYPEGLAWRPDVMATETRNGDEVRSIGRAREWYVPEQPGRVSGRDTDTRTIHYTGLTVATGVSGAPIVSGNGIIAMHIESVGEEAHGIELGAIQQRLVEQARRRWILVPRADCRDLASQRSALADRRITLHFDTNRPDRAMQATARLNCLGARVTLRPIWDAGAWPGESITYGSGNLRIGRTVQTVLAAIGRLDVKLGQPEGDADVWVR